MPDRYAPALLLDVFVFWFVLRWLLLGRVIRFFGRLLVLMMVVGALGTLDERKYVWAVCFAGAALLAWMLLRCWRRLPMPWNRVRLSAFLAWRRQSPVEVATICERRIGLPVDAAAPATVAGHPPAHCIFALAGDGLWVLEDESGLGRPQIGPVVACWDRSSLVAHIEHARRGERFELSWPRQGALVRGIMPSGAPADLLAGHLVADELLQQL